MRIDLKTLMSSQGKVCGLTRILWAWPLGEILHDQEVNQEVFQEAGKRFQWMATTFSRAKFENSATDCFPTDLTWKSSHFHSSWTEQGERGGSQVGLFFLCFVFCPCLKCVKPSECVR